MGIATGSAGPSCLPGPCDVLRFVTVAGAPTDGTSTIDRRCGIAHLDRCRYRKCVCLELARLLDMAELSPRLLRPGLVRADSCPDDRSVESERLHRRTLALCARRRRLSLCRCAGGPVPD